MSLVLHGTDGVTFNDSSLQGAAASPYVLKNRIINGAMVIDQRNAGASGTGAGYTVDRWAFVLSQASKLTWQQNAGAVTPPAGFTNYFGFTSSSAYSVLSGDYFYFQQPIEGFNIADLAFGTASAKTVTLSFWVRSSLTGTFGGSFQNGTSTRTYPFSYTISSANTWTQISVTIPGDTTGTWVTNNGHGASVFFSLGMGSTYSGTAGAWSSTNFISATGATSVVGTNGATWYVTGVQLEIGTSATPFERRLYNQELANCQRYYVNGLSYVNGFAYNTTTGVFGIIPPVTFRATPTVGYTSGSTVSVDFIGGTQNATISIAAGGAYASTKGISLAADGMSGRTAWQGIILVGGNWFLSAEL